MNVVVRKVSVNFYLMVEFVLEFEEIVAHENFNNTIIVLG
jgi:hypothetical protein